MRLLATADGVMHNYRPGKMERLGLGYGSLREHFPDLIYLAISGMGDVGPYAGQKVYDYVIQGLSGILDAQGTHNRFEMVRTIIYDKVTALTAAQAMTAGLYNKAMGGEAQKSKCRCWIQVFTLTGPISCGMSRLSAMACSTQGSR